MLEIWFYNIKAWKFYHFITKKYDKIINEYYNNRLIT